MRRGLLILSSLFCAVLFMGQVPFPASPIAGASQYGITIASATTLTVPSNANYAVVCVESANARYTADGTTPTATVGMPLLQNQCVSLQSNTTLQRFQIIQQTAGATIDASYYR